MIFVKENMGKIFWIIYIQPLRRIVVFMALMVTLWGILGKIEKKKQWWSIINTIVFVSTVLIILYMTIYSRSDTEEDVGVGITKV